MRTDEDRKNLERINSIFAMLSMRGKGICLEQLMRRYNKDVMYE